MIDTCNNKLCPSKNYCAIHDNHFTIETIPTHHDFTLISGNFACEDFVYMRIKSDLETEK